MGIQTTPKTPTALSIRIQYYDGSAWYDMTATELKALFDANSAGTYVGEFETQYASPLTGESVEVSSSTGGGNVHLQLRPAGTIATLGVSFPSSVAGSVEAADLQEVIITTSNTVTALALNGNGATIQGAATNLTAESFLRYKYDEQFNQWIRVG